MKRFLLFLLVCFSVGKIDAQTFMLGTDIGGSSTIPYTNYTMSYNAKGFYETSVLETFTSPSGSRKWAFNADNNSNTWRAPNSGIVVTGYNTVIAPTISTASAYFRAGVNQGSDGQMLATTANTKYYFRISGKIGSNNYSNQNMVIMALNFIPYSLSGASHIVGTDTVKLNTFIITGENLFVRYSTYPNFTSSKVAQVNVPASSTIGTFKFSGNCSSTVYYYFYTSIAALTAIDSSVNLIGESAHDLLAFSYLNNGGSSYSITANPSVNISGNSSLCASTTINLTSSGSNGATPYIYTWSSSNSTVISSVTSPGATTTIGAASMGGNTNVNVTLIDANGCTATNSQSETVYPTPSGGTITGNFGNICVGSFLTLTASSSGGTPPFAYTWLNPNPSVATLNPLTGINTTITGIALGSSNIHVIITDKNNCSTTGLRLENVNSNPSVSITATETSCTSNDDKVLSGTSDSLTATGSGGSGSYSIYTWDNSLGTGATKKPTVTATTTFNVTVTDSKGCTGTNSKTVTVITAPNISITGNTSVCVGSSTLFSAFSTTGASPYTYNWSSSTPTSATINPSSGTSTSVTGIASGNSNINAMVSDNNGCTASNSKNVIVNVRPVVSISNKINDVCMTKNGSIKLTVTNGLPNYTISWTNGSAQSGTITTAGGSLTAIGLPAGNISFFVTDTNGCTIISQ